MSKEALLAFMRRHVLAVQSSVSPEGMPQSAVIGYVVDDRLELFFDTKTGARKARNLRADPRIALVIGWDLEEACTLQIEGVADEPSGDELAAFKTIYFERFPDGVEREGWPDIAYFRVRPTWARFSDFRTPAPTIIEFTVESSAWR